MAEASRHAVILAGGPGSRLWPLSRAGRPKFVLPLLPGRPSSLVDTWDRLAPLVGADHVWVVTGEAYAAAVAEDLPDLRPDRLLVEPSAKDSLPALALAAASIVREDPDAVLAACPADNHATDAAAFGRAVETAFAAAGPGLCAVGLLPTSASSAFGYIEVADPAVRDRDQRAVAFTEKPPPEVAAAYVAGGRHLWNGGVYVGAASTVLAETARFRPEVLAAVELGGDEAWTVLAPVSIDRGLSEAVADAGRLRVVPAEFGWQDTGDYAALFEALAADVDGPLDDSVLLVDASGLVLPSPGRTVSVLGIDDVVVVDTADAVLVTTLQHAQRVREVVAGWRERHREDLL